MYEILLVDRGNNVLFQICLFLNYKPLSLNKYIQRWIMGQNNDDQVYNHFKFPCKRMSNHRHLNN